MRFQVPLGRYFIGDPCFALSDAVYDGVWGNRYMYRPGEIFTPRGTFIVDSTASGDGMYADSSGFVYPVESGTIALIPVSMCDAFDSEADAALSGRVIVSAHPISWHSEYGLFEITSETIGVTVDTAPESAGSTEESYAG